MNILEKVGSYANLVNEFNPKQNYISNQESE